MSTWQLIFQQSRVNNGAYNGDSLPVQKWDWPEQTWFQKRLRSLRNQATAKTNRSVHSNPMADKGGFSMNFSIVPLLLAEEEIPAEARQALAENRLNDAAELLMRDYELSCVEASDLLDVSACSDA
jgi:hypothetical protein